jgi:hypothetical protein
MQVDAIARALAGKALVWSMERRTAEDESIR